MVIFQGRAVPAWPQPARGLVSCALAGVVAWGAFALYRLVATGVAGLDDLSPSREASIWIATTMLAITFPAMSILADLFDFWPLSTGRTASVADD